MTSKVRSRYRKCNIFKFVLEVSIVVGDVLVLEQENGNTLWKYAINKEMKNSHIDFEIYWIEEETILLFSSKSHVTSSLMLRWTLQGQPGMNITVQFHLHLLHIYWWLLPLVSMFNFNYWNFPFLMKLDIYFFSFSTWLRNQRPGLIIFILNKNRIQGFIRLLFNTSIIKELFFTQEMFILL